jgi:hypothetical protein
MFGLPRILFYLPSRQDILIFDREGSEVLKKCVFENLPTTVLPVRRETYFLTPAVLVQTIIRFIRVRRWDLSHLLNAYFYACIFLLKPKVVVTFIDNERHFHALSRAFSQITFIAVQNGVRCAADITRTDQLSSGVLPPIGQLGSVIDIPHFFCLGQQDVDLYRSFGHRIDHFYPVGSVRGSHFQLKVLPSLKLRPSQGTCLVSQWMPDFVGQQFLSEHMEGFLNLVDQIKKLDTRFFPIRIALRSNDPREKQFFKDRLGVPYEFVEFDRDKFSSYRALEESEIAIAFNSTIAYEAFSCGKKILFVNLSGKSYLDFPKAGFWALNCGEESQLTTKLRILQNMSIAEYQYATREIARYVMNNDLSIGTAGDRIRGFVLRHLL